MLGLIAEKECKLDFKKKLPSLGTGGATGTMQHRPPLDK
jgi:hypothetical protein